MAARPNHHAHPRISDSWMSRAACRDADPSLFFGSDDAKRTIAQEREAKRLCWRCPVRDECLSYALRSGCRVGVWGGLNEGQRRRRIRLSATTGGGLE